MTQDEEILEAFVAQKLPKGPTVFPTALEALDWAAADLFAGFMTDLGNGLRGPAFAPDPSVETAFRRADFADNFVGKALHIENQISVVPWEFDCVHVGAFQTLPPTGQSLTIRGTTFISKESPTAPRDRDSTTREVVVRRYINWMDVVANLEIAVAYRPLVNRRWPDELPIGAALE
jgi:hypothetical protein